MPSTFGPPYIGEEIDRAVEIGAHDCHEAIVKLKDGRTFQGELCINHKYHPGKDFGLRTNTIIAFDYTEVKSIALGGPFGPPKSLNV